MILRGREMTAGSMVENSCCFMNGLGAGVRNIMWEWEDDSSPEPAILLQTRDPSAEFFDESVEIEAFLHKVGAKD